ncbi:MAG TPA: sialate O-acetylesterase [Humisphaera sp.]
MIRRLARLAVVALAASAAAPAFADVKLPNVLSDHMVLQRGRPLPVWGTAAAGEKVTVKFRGKEKAATAGADGKWRVNLDPVEAGGPDELTVAGNNTVAIKDVLVGEVWVGSGQSNMAGAAGGYAKNDPVLAKMIASDYPKIRLLKGNGKWYVANPQTIPGFSAILFSFGVNLQKELDVPMGLMVGAVGGTPSGYWLSEAALKDDEGVKASVEAAKKTYDPAKAQAAYDAALKKHEADAAAAKAAGKQAPRKPYPPAGPGEATGGKAGYLYEAHIRPMIPFGIRGVLWDQGESGTAVNGVDQFVLMGALIKGWRKEWGQEFPWVYIQKPSGLGCAWDPADPVTDKADKFEPLPAAVPNDGASRELHVRIMKHPDTYMATASDLGPNVHPTNKSGYGARAARVALGAVYGKKVEIYGPVYKSHAVQGDKVRVTFDHVGQGLAFKHGEKLQGFAVAGADGKFVWADATIDGDAVVVSSPQVKEPKAVRYAYAQKHTWANLFNKDGLPALPFRTDAQ